MPRPLKIVGLLALGLAVLIGGYFAMWAFIGVAIRVEPSRIEVARLASPSGAVEAVVSEWNGGAATSFGYFVAIVPAGEQADSTHDVAYLYGARRGERAYGVGVRWRGTDDLLVEYLDARHAEVRKPTIRVDDEQIGVSLSSGVSDPTAPPGGMLHNLRRPGN